MHLLKWTAVHKSFAAIFLIVKVLQDVLFFFLMTFIQGQTTYDTNCLFLSTTPPLMLWHQNDDHLSNDGAVHKNISRGQRPLIRSGQRPI